MIIDYPSLSLISLDKPSRCFAAARCTLCESKSAYLSCLVLKIVESDENASDLIIEIEATDLPLDS